MNGVTRKHSITLVWCLFILYSVSTFTKINYSASIAYIVKEGIFSKTNSGIINAAFYLTYGLGQIFGAKLVDKYSPYNIELVSLLGSFACNLALCFSNNYLWVLAMWSLNGIMLYPSWPACVKMVAECVDAENKKFGTTLLTISIAFGGILSYSCVSVVLEAFGWSGMFIMNSGVLLFMAAVWYFIKLRTEKYLYVKKETVIKQEKVLPTENFIHLILRSGVGIIILIFLVRAVLDNGLKAWIPTMMMENYQISTVWAGLQNAVISICNMLAVFVIVPLMVKLKNEMKMMALLYTVSLPFLALLIFIGKIPLVIATGAFIIITSFTYTLTNVQVMVSSKFASIGVGHSGAVAALLNAFASFGVLIASVLFGFIAENFSWQMVVILCIALVILAVLLSLPAYIMWKKFLGHGDE